jgi:hypothetical protein
MWLFSLQGRGLAVQVPHDPAESTFISVEFVHVYRTEILPSFLSWNLMAGDFFFFHERSVRS